MAMCRVNPEFASLIPPLTPEERAGLEKSILEEGVREPIITWQGWIVDGHNRHEIATAHGLDFDTVEYDFEDEGAAKEWMILNQFSRRNINAYQRSVLALQLKEVIAARAKEKQREGGYEKVSQKSVKPIDTQKEIAAFAGVSHDTISKVEHIEREASDGLKEQVRNGDMSINAAYRQVREGELRKQRQAAIEEAKSKPRSSSFVDIATTDKRYRVVYADPPWSYGDKQDIGGLGGAGKHYETMPLDDICALRVPTEENAVLFLWVTSPMLQDAFAVIGAWGFSYKSSFVWDKVAHNMGHYNSVRHEFLLIATKGSCTPDVKRLHDSVVSIERTGHSEKPGYFRELIDGLYPVGNRIELFARSQHDGWDAWGDMA